MAFIAYLKRNSGIKDANSDFVTFNVLYLFIQLSVPYPFSAIQFEIEESSCVDLMLNLKFLTNSDYIVFTCYIGRLYSLHS